MRIDMKFSPNILREASLLVYEAVNYENEDLELLEDKELLSNISDDEKIFLEEYRNNLEEIIKDANYKLREYTKVKKYINLKSDTNKNGYLTSVIMINKAENIEELSLKSFKQASVYNLLTYDNSSSIEYKYERIEDDIDEVILLNNIFQILEEIDISIDEKYTYLEYFKNIEEIYEEYKKMLYIAKDVYEKYYPKFEKYITLAIGKYKEDLDDEDYMYDYKKLYISNYINIDEIQSKVEELEYYISVVEYNAMSIVISEENRFKGRCVEGALYFYLIKIKNTHKELSKGVESKLIAFGDSTRIKIINMLFEREYYAKEISEKLELSPSTVSHHIEILLNNEILKIKVEGRRIYYSLNKETMVYLSKIFSKYGGE